MECWSCCTDSQALTPLVLPFQLSPALKGNVNQTDSFPVLEEPQRDDPPLLPCPVAPQGLKAGVNYSSRESIESELTQWKA